MSLEEAVKKVNSQIDSLTGRSYTVSRYEHVIQAVFCQPWAILPSVYATICEVVRMRAEGHRFTAEEIQQRIGAAPVRAGAARSGAVAVLPLFGVLAQRVDPLAATSGMTSTAQFGRVFQAALSDPEVSAVVIDVDSPGGMVMGTQELWQTIFDARGKKPIIAQVDSLMASAAYWIGSAADEIVITPSGEVGSLGVILAHQDRSGEGERVGVKTTLITYGEHKAIGNPFEPLSDEARAIIQKSVNESGRMMDQAIARGRGVPVSTVRDRFGQGLMFHAQEAVSLGLADRVATLQQTMDRLTGRGGSRSGARAETVSFGEMTMTMIETPDLTALDQVHEPELEQEEKLPKAGVKTMDETRESLELRARRLRLLDRP